VEIGSKIKKSRIDAKLTQEQAAEALGAKTESESVKNDLATIIQELINNGALDLSSFNG